MTSYHHYLNHHQNLCKDVVVIVISSPPLDFVVDRYIVNTPWLLAPCLTSTRCWWWGGGWGEIISTPPKSFAGGVCDQFFSPKVSVQGKNLRLCLTQIHKRAGGPPGFFENVHLILWQLSISSSPMWRVRQKIVNNTCLCVSVVTSLVQLSTLPKFFLWDNSSRTRFHMMVPLF